MSRGLPHDVRTLLFFAFQSYRGTFKNLVTSNRSIAVVRFKQLQPEKYIVETRLSFIIALWALGRQTDVPAVEAGPFLVWIKPSVQSYGTH